MVDKTNLFFYLWRSKPIRSVIFDFINNDVCKQLVLSLQSFLDNYQRFKQLYDDHIVFTRITLVIRIEKDDFFEQEDAIRFIKLPCVNMIDTLKLILEDTGETKGIVIPDAFIRQGIKSVVIRGKVGNQGITRQLIPSSVTKIFIQNAILSLNIQIDSFHNGVKVLCLGDCGQSIPIGALPSSLKSLSIRKIGQLDKGVLPQSLTDFNMAIVAVMSPESIPLSVTKLESLVTKLDNHHLPPNLTSLRVRSPLQLIPPSVTTLEYKISSPPPSFSTSNLVSIMIEYDYRSSRIPFNIHPGTFPETLESLHLRSYVGEIHPNSLPTSLTDLYLYYATNFSVAVLSLPDTITKLFIRQSPMSRNAELNVLLPLSLTDLQLIDSPQLVQRPLPVGLKKLVLSNSDLSPTNIVPPGVTDLSYSFSHNTTLYPHHLPTSLIHLYLYSNLQTISFPHLRTLDHLKEMETTSSLDLTYLPPNLTKLSIEIPPSHADATNIQLPNTITDLTLWSNQNGEPITFTLPASVTRLTLRGDIHPDFNSKLPLLQTLIYESDSLTIENLDFLPNSVTSIINLPMITSNTFTLPPLLNTLEISSTNYKHNFTDKGISLSSHVKFLTIMD